MDEGKLTNQTGVQLSGHSASASGRGKNSEAHAQLELARQRLLSAAIAFCDGSISAGQLRAVRELLREKEQNLSQLEGKFTPPFKKEPEPALPIINPDVVPAPLS